MSQRNPTVTSIFYRAHRLTPVHVAHEMGEEFVLELQLDRSRWPTERGLWVATAEFHDGSGFVEEGPFQRPLGWHHRDWRRLTIQELAALENGTWTTGYDPGTP